MKQEEQQIISIEDLCELIESTFNISCKLNKNSSLAEDARLSSVDLAVLLIRLEHKMGIEIDVTKLASIQTIGDLYDAIN